MQILRRLTYENILASVDEYSILKYYWPGFEGPGLYYSNLRVDDVSTKSLSVIVKGGRFKLTDFGTRYKMLSVPDYIRALLKLPEDAVGYRSVLTDIVKKFNLSIIKATDAIEVDYTAEAKIYDLQFANHTSTEINYEVREWGSLAVDRYYWGRKHKVDFNKLIPILKRYNVHPLDRYWINDRLYSPQRYNPAYGIIYKPYIKVYKPMENVKARKWVSTIPKEVIPGIHTLPPTGNLLLIEKSTKDAVLSNYLGYNSISLNSESTFLPVEIYESLKKRFKNIIVHLDNDNGGLTNAIRFQRDFGVSCIVNPMFTPKDNSEVCEEYGIDGLDTLLKSLI